MSSNLIIYPMNLYYLIYLYNNVVFSFNKIKITIYLNFFKNFFFLFDFYLLNDLLWQEGLLIDFIQKKITDNWIKKFLIYATYLFNERFVFDKITRFYLDLFILPLNKLFIFEFDNISKVLFTNVFIFIFIILIFFLLYVMFLMF